MGWGEWSYEKKGSAIGALIFLLLVISLFTYRGIANIGNFLLGFNIINKLFEHLTFLSNQFFYGIGILIYLALVLVIYTFLGSFLGKIYGKSITR